MSTIKISELTEKLTMVGTEEVLINDSGISKKFSTQRFLDAKAAAEAAQTAAEVAQTAAETAETNAETAETNAAASASAASTSASNAATSASEASTSATNASNSAGSAATAQSAAESARDSALAAYDSFDDRYLGVKASAPTLDNDGDALVAGALYFDSTSQKMQLYTGSIWVDAYTTGTSFLAVANNLSDLNNAATARTNLGLGTAATTASTDYATAAQGSNADTAYGWGNHASAGYLTTYTETDPVYTASSWYTTTNNSTNWDTAYGWGNHASAGYITGNQTITLSGDATGSGTTAITVTVADDSHNHIISNVDGLQTALDGKMATGTDKRAQIYYIGRDTNDYIGVETTQINFVLDGNTDARLYNNGDFHADGNVIAYSTSISDSRLKKDITPVENALDKVCSLNGVEFTYTYEDKRSAGVIAQEVEAVLPQAVKETTLGLKTGDETTAYKVVEYDQLHALLIEAVKELTARVEALEAK